MADAVKIGDRTLLDLSTAEAETLRILMAFIGGSPSKSRRGYCDDIAESLQSVGFHPTDMFNIKSGGRITFLNLDTPPEDLKHHEELEKKLMSILEKGLL